MALLSYLFGLAYFESYLPYIFWRLQIIKLQFSFLSHQYQHISHKQLIPFFTSTANVTSLNHFKLIPHNKINKKMRGKSKQRPTEPTSLSSSYSKYQCQHKHKSILTKLSNDSGYPQDILTSQRTTPRENNFVQQNKKNLKNFFKERIPAENILLGKLMKRENDMINPKKMFEMKQMQYELKNKTKINLQKEFQAELQQIRQSPFSKVNASFQINDKNRELKEKYGGKMNLSFYQDQNYRRGTHSHIGKRSKILKKEAYDKVFGPDISSLSRTAVFSKPVTEVATPPRAKSISLNPTPNTVDHHNLRTLINKMSGYKNKLQDRSQEHGIAPYQQQFQEKEYESHLITMIRNMTNFYLGKNIKQGYQKIEQLQDLNKIYKDYYTNMTIHKNNRLNKRLQHVNQTITVNHQAFPVSQFHSKQLGDDNQSIFSYAEMPAEEVEESIIVVGSIEEGPVHSVKNRFKLLKRTLVRWAALFYMYGIKRKDIFIAFRANKQPYQLEGSYVFFKCIKIGDLQSVKNFISKNSDFIFQTESFGRSPLSYACIHNQIQIAECILEQGVNSDKVCNNKKTSLFYALHGRNIDLIKMILQKGASPWSTAHNPYSSIIKTGPNSSELSILFNNARKVYLGMQIQPTIHQRKQFWQRYSKRITEHTRITFQHFLQ